MTDWLTKSLLEPGGARKLCDELMGAARVGLSEMRDPATDAGQLPILAKEVDVHLTALEQILSLESLFNDAGATKEDAGVRDLDLEAARAEIFARFDKLAAIEGEPAGG